MITLNEWKAIYEAKKQTDLIICDVQEDFKKYFNNTYLLELKKYCEDFQRVYQIWDGNNSDEESYYFPNQIEVFRKEYGGELNIDDVDYYFYSDIRDIVLDKFKTGFNAGDKFKTKMNTYFVYIGNKHEWFYCEEDLANFLEDNKRKITLVGGATEECIHDIYVTAKSFGCDIEYNFDYMYSAKGCKFQDIDSDKELDGHLNEIEYAVESKDIEIFDEIPEDMEIVKIIDIFTDLEEIKESLGKRLQNTTMNYQDIKNNQIIYITCMLKPRNSSIANTMGEIGVLQCRVMNQFYGLNKLKQLHARGEIILR